MSGKRGRPPHPDILTPREWEVLDLLREGQNNPQIGERLGISLAGARYHVSEILGKLGLNSRYAAAAWQPTPIPWWRAASLSFLAWPFNKLWWGAGVKVAATVVVAATVAAFAVPEGFGLLVTDPEVGPVPDFSNFSYVTANGRFRLTDNPARDAGGAWSPDCSRIAFTSNREGSIASLGDIYTMYADGSNIVNLTVSPRGDIQPTWSPDGTRIAFASESRGNSDIYVMSSDGTGQTNLTNMPGLNLTPGWSPDGERILFTRYRGLTPEVYVMNSDGTLPLNVTRHGATDGWASWSPDGGQIGFPSWSPDGARIAFQSSRDGNWEIYVMNADGSSQTRLTNNSDEDGFPSWSPDGARIAYVSRTGEGSYEIYVMNVDGSDQVRLTPNPPKDGLGDSP